MRLGEWLRGDFPNVAFVAGCKLSALCLIPSGVKTSSGTCRLATWWIPQLTSNMKGVFMLRLAIVASSRQNMALQWPRRRNNTSRVLAGQEKYIFMRLRATVAHAFRHRVRLCPNDVLPQIPTIGAQGEGD